MVSRLIKIIGGFFPVAMLVTGCSKYAPLQPVSSAAYLRVFNSITNYDVQDLSHLDLAGARTLTLLIDPVMGSSPIPQSAATVGDWLYFRAFYAAPFETKPDQLYRNTEYPGSYTVRVGGDINGLDASRWAQVSSGSHRVMVLRRRTASSLSPAYFDDVPVGARDSMFLVAMDTTLNFSAQGVYTLEIHNADPNDASRLKWYLRQESFPTEVFDSSKGYVNFYNMMTAPSTPAALDVYVHMQYIDNCIGPLQTKNTTPLAPTPWTYSFDPNNDGLGYVPYNTPETLLTRITGKFPSASQYVALPMPVVDSFFYYVGPAFGQFRIPFDRPKYVLDFYLPGQNKASGATPYVELLCDEFNEPALTNTSEDLNPFYWEMTTVPKKASPYMCNLYQTVTYNNNARAFPMVNTIELLNTYDALNTPSANIKVFQIALQRPYEANFIH